MDVFGFLKNKSKVKVYSADEVDAKIKSLITANDIFPIGSVFIDESVDADGNSTDYSKRFGFTWERTLQGVMPIGIDIDDETVKDNLSKIGNSGGEKEHILTTEEMPSHTHSITEYNINTDWEPKTAHRDAGTSKEVYDKYDNSTTSKHTSSKTSASTGGGEAHNNLPPYKVVAYWKRIA